MCKTNANNLSHILEKPRLVLVPENWPYRAINWEKEADRARITQSMICWRPAVRSGQGWEQSQWVLGFGSKRGDLNSVRTKVTFISSGCLSLLYFKLIISKMSGIFLVPKARPSCREAPHIRQLVLFICSVLGNYMRNTEQSFSGTITADNGSKWLWPGQGGSLNP